jgi:hypothetical protein
MSEYQSIPHLLPLHYEGHQVRHDSTLADEEKLTQWALFEYLAAAVDSNTKLDAWNLMREAREHAVRLNLYTMGFANLYGACVTEITWRFQDTEYQSYPRFKDALSSLLPGAKIVTPPKKYRLRPDFFVERDGLISCVELKRRIFTQSSVKQLSRYMQTYELPTGYAVAPKLTGVLERGMMFLQWPNKE